MAEFPGFTIWTDAYLADTGHLTTLEHGAYFLLLLAMWRAGGYLPNDDVKLARFCRATPGDWKKIRAHLLEFFTEDGDKITQGRLLDELEKARERSRKASDNARSKYRKTKEVKPADAKPKRSQTPARDHAEPLQNDSQTDASISISISTEEKKETSFPKKGTRIPEDFEPDLDAAVADGLRPERALMEAAKFKDYWKAKSGKDATKVDWPATWRNWYRTAIERQGGPRGSPSQAKSAYRQHQDDVDQSFRDALKGTQHEQPSGNVSGGQPSFDLEEGNFRSDRTASAFKR